MGIGNFLIFYYLFLILLHVGLGGTEQGTNSSEKYIALASRLALLAQDDYNWRIVESLILFQVGNGTEERASVDCWRDYDFKHVNPALSKIRVNDLVSTAPGNKTNKGFKIKWVDFTTDGINMGNFSLYRPQDLGSGLYQNGSCTTQDSISVEADSNKEDGYYFIEKSVITTSEAWALGRSTLLFEGYMSGSWWATPFGESEIEYWGSGSGSFTSDKISLGSFKSSVEATGNFATEQVDGDRFQTQGDIRINISICGSAVGLTKAEGSVNLTNFLISSSTSGKFFGLPHEPDDDTRDIDSGNFETQCTTNFSGICSGTSTTACNSLGLCQTTFSIPNCQVTLTVLCTTFEQGLVVTESTSAMSSTDSLSTSSADPSTTDYSFPEKERLNLQLVIIIAAGVVLVGGVVSLTIKVLIFFDNDIFRTADPFSLPRISGLTKISQTQSRVDVEPEEIDRLRPRGMRRRDRSILFVDPKSLALDIFPAEVETFYPDEDLEIPIELLQIDENKVLGSGHFGIVTLGSMSKFGLVQLVAVKRLTCNTNLQNFLALVSEIKILANLDRHQNIACLQGACTISVEQRHVFAIFEYCTNGDLKSYLIKNRQFFKFKPKRIKDQGTVSSKKPQLWPWDLYEFARGIADGMTYLASKHVIHADLAARNILLTENNNIKISDFGLSRRLVKYSSYIQDGKIYLPWPWLSIEALQRLEFSLKSDVWAFGVVLSEVFSLGEDPYPDFELNPAFVNKLCAGWRINKPIMASCEIYNVMLECWEVDPEKRPCIEQIKGSLFKVSVDASKKLCFNNKSDKHQLSAPCLTYPANNGYKILGTSPPFQRSYVMPTGTLDF